MAKEKKPNVYKKREDGKNDTGREPKYESPEQMQSKIDEYFEVKVKRIPFLNSDGEVITSKRGIPLYDVSPPTVAGLTLYLGFASRQSLYDYRNNKPNFAYTIKKAITRIEQYAEIQLTQGNSTGAIFWLKNHGWFDKKQTELTGKDGGAIKTESKIDISKLKELKDLLK